MNRCRNINVLINMLINVNVQKNIHKKILIDGTTVN